MGKQLPRTLAAVMYADVAGYSRLIGDDEDRTHLRLAEYLDLIAARVAEHRGEVKHYAGDAVLAMFPAVVDAFTCAVEAQSLLRQHNADLPEEERLEFRIGLNLGDVIEDRGDIYGDGVNIAARLESIAEPGGICVSSAVYQQVHGKSDLAFEDLGRRQLKNIAEPVRAWRVLDQPRLSAAETYRVLTGEKLELPQRPSIAVLPFVNLSGDSGQEHYADGMTEDIITVLSRLPDLVVMARNSTFVYKDRAVDVREVGRELGVGFVLEGSLRKSGDRLRVNAQLIDARSGEHLWAERFDRHADDLFAIQDDILRDIVVELQVKLVHGDESRIRAERPTSFEAWELMQLALAQQLQFSREGNDEAQRLIARVLALDPDYRIAKLLLGWVLQTAARFGFADDPAAAVARADSLAREVIAQDPSNGDAHALLSFILTNQCKVDEGIVHGRRAVEASPGSATCHAALATALYYRGEYQTSLAHMKKAMRLSPYAPDWIVAGLGDAYHALGDLQQAREVLELLAARLPDSPLTLIRLIWIYADLGAEAEMRKAAENLIGIAPGFSVEHYVRAIPFQHEEIRAGLAQALLDAGLPA